MEAIIEQDVRRDVRRMANNYFRDLAGKQLEGEKRTRALLRLREWYNREQKFVDFVGPLNDPQRRDRIEYAVIAAETIQRVINRRQEIT